MKLLRPALALTAFFVVVTGLAFPVGVWAVGRLCFPFQAGGSLLRDVHGRSIGSALIGQGFSRPEYFHPRPSAVGYAAANSGGSNLGPSSTRLRDELAALAAAYRADNGLAPDARLPADAVTRSASGLDPHISPANAALQLGRVARARGLAPPRLQRLVSEHTEGRTFGLLGEPRVDVLRLNLALDALR